MTVNELKEAVAKRLRIDPATSMHDMVKTVETVSGLRKHYRQNGYDYLRVWLGVKREYSVPANQIDPRKRKEWSWPRSNNPRADNLDIDQPRMITPNGIGNGAERQHGFSRGS